MDSKIKIFRSLNSRTRIFRSLDSRTIVFRSLDSRTACDGPDKEIYCNGEQKINLSLNI